MKRVYFHGCAFNLRGKKGELIKKPWAVSTTDLRLIQFLDQCKCDGKHEHEPAMGGNAAHTACSDAIQAFLQSRLDEDDFTLVIIPVELWLPDWKNRFGEDARLAVRLRKSLYGHPMTGRWWQDHLTSCLVSLGGIEIQEHPSNFLFRWNPSKHGGDVDHEYVLLLNVYVDDLTLSGHRSCHGSFWSALSSKVKMEPFQEIDSKGLLILGRRHFIEKGPSQTKITFDMRTYVDQVVGSYCELTGTKQQSLKKVSTPSYPENTMTDQELSQTGELSGVASRILMRALWLSRLARPDISFIVGRLTTRVTQWTKFEDRQLYRCICYLHHSRDKVLVGEIDHAHEHEASIEVYTDADFAGCPHSAKSTSGIMIAIKTGGATYPLHWSSRKQSSVARSTPEAELIAMSTAMFTEVFNVQTMLEHLMQRPVPVNYRQDNQAVVQILETGYSAKLRHAPRVHRVNVSSVHEVLQDEHMHAVWYTQTSEQIANGLTKVITPAEWPAMLKQLCICDFAVGSAT